MNVLSNLLRGSTEFSVVLISGEDIKIPCRASLSRKVGQMKAQFLWLI